MVKWTNDTCFSLKWESWIVIPCLVCGYSFWRDCRVAVVLSAPPNGGKVFSPHLVLGWLWLLLAKRKGQKWCRAWTLAGFAHFFPTTWLTSCKWAGLACWVVTDIESLLLIIDQWLRPPWTGWNPSNLQAQCRRAWRSAEPGPGVAKLLCQCRDLGTIIGLLLLSCSVVSNSLRPHGLPHTRLPCPSPSPGACSNSCPLSWWCQQL